MDERKPSDCIAASIFYGDKVLRTDPPIKDTKEYYLTPYPHKLFDVNDASHTWLIFKKQQKALDYIRMKRHGLMAFAFQHGMGERSFLVADPRVFWHHDSKRKPELRSSYEIIVEHSACKLYFDLEFDKNLNPHHDGIQMTSVLNRVVGYYLNKFCNVCVSEKNIICLDSSTSIKFSQHLVYNLDSHVFKDNYNVGNFVKYICREILDTVNQDKGELLQFADRDSLRRLFVLNKNSRNVIFCDICVYSKNRHFRLYQNTKLNKNSPLTLYFENGFNSANNINTISETCIFLNTLITYVQDNLNILEFNISDKSESVFESNKGTKQIIVNGGRCSPFPEIDAFINTVVFPGHVWRWCYFSSCSSLVYDIVNYRYCGNIQREHRSNNIKYIVNLTTGSMYQKCHDPECSNYSSEPVKLPVKLFQSLNDIMSHEELFDLEIDDIHDDELAALLDVIEDGSIKALGELISEAKSESLPDCGVSDLELIQSTLDISEK